MYELLILLTLIQVKCPRRLFCKKNAFLFVLFTMIVKNVVPLFSFSSTGCPKKKLYTV